MVKKVGNTASINHAAAAQSAARYAVSPSHGPSAAAATAKARVTDVCSVGDLAREHGQTRTLSSHNDINRFMSNVNMHHPYNGPSSKSLGNDQELAQKDTTSRSSNRTPSGGGTAKSKAAMKMAQVKKVTGRNDVMSENTQPGGNRTGLSDVANRLAGKGRK